MCGFRYGLCYIDGGGGGVIRPNRPLMGGYTHQMHFGFYFGTIYANVISAVVFIWSNTINYLLTPKFKRMNFMTSIFITLEYGVCKLCWHVCCCIFTPYQGNVLLLCLCWCVPTGKVFKLSGTG